MIPLKSGTNVPTEVRRASDEVNSTLPFMSSSSLLSEYRTAPLFILPLPYDERRISTDGFHPHRKHTFRLCKQYITVAEASPVLRRYKALRLHKGIKHADKRNSLSVEILQIEKLKAAEFGRTQSSFYLILIALRTMCADRLEEISPLRVKSLFFKPFSENIEIARNERTCVHFISSKSGK